MTDTPAKRAPLIVGDAVQLGQSLLNLSIRGPVANFSRPVGELCENAARSTFWLYVWVLRRSKPYLWLSRGRFGRAQFARKPRVEKFCDRPPTRRVHLLAFRPTRESKSGRL